MINKTLPQQAQITNVTSNQKIAYNIAHEINGRIRFHVYRLVKDSQYAEKLKALIESDSRVTKVRINSQAASIAINYDPDIPHEQMREHLINLIQSAPNIALPKRFSISSVTAAIFDAMVNLIDSARNVNKARKVITKKTTKPDFWEQALTTLKGTIKTLKSAVMFILPKRVSHSPRNAIAP
jgi:Heavy metal associated domain 2